MLPRILAFGPFSIHSYGLTIALGVFLSLYLMKRSAKKEGFPPVDRVFDLVFVTVMAGFLGARLLYVIQEWPWYARHPWEILQLWKGGLVYYGGMIASFIGFYLYVRSARIPFLEGSDFTIPYIALTHFFGRVGCFLNGCCYGKFCDLPWAVQFPFLPKPVHPIQLYESFFNLILFFFLVCVYSRRRFSGEVTFDYLMIYGLGRFFLEFFRGDQASLLFSLTLQQILSVFFFFLGAILYGISCRLHGQRS